MRQRAVAAAVLAVASLAVPAGATPAPCSDDVERVAGGTWERRPVAGIEGPGFTFEMTADEADPRLVVVNDAVGILVSRDGGCRWTRSLLYDELFPDPSGAFGRDVEVAGTGAERSLHVLVDPWPAPTDALVSSFDDGRTWRVVDLPPLAADASVDVMASAASPTLFVFARPAGGTGVLYAGTGSDGRWRWVAVTQGSPAATCAPDGPCMGPTLTKLLADPARAETLWAPGSPEGVGDDAFMRSDDGGASWEQVPAPDGAVPPHLFDVAPGRHPILMLLASSHVFAVSRDGGRSWAVGRLPQLVSGDFSSGGAFELAHFGRGATFGLVLGHAETSSWAGNVLVFDGRRWENVSPPDLIGYDRTDEEGRPLTVVELAGSRGPLLALTSAGDLMTYRR